MKSEVVICGVPFNDENIEEILKKIKADGFTSVQIYTHWGIIEPMKRGKFDFSFYDRQVELIKNAGLKFVPFIIMGPKYAHPEWWLTDESHKGLVCLEHGKESPIESIWNMNFRSEIDRVVGAIAEHYLPMDVLESIQPGICGDYGEAIFPVHGNWPGAYHTHRGMWCGGDDAKASFQNSMQKKYADISTLNSAWRSYYSDFTDITPFLQHRAPSRTAWFDLLDWYRGSMTEFADFWMSTARKYFPDTPFYLCTGGLEEPTLGALFSDQAKISAKYNAGIRLTNERNDFFENFFFDTAYTHSACEYYGAYMGLEPVGAMTKEGIGSRIFSSSVFANRQIFFYYYNLYPEKNMDNEYSRIFSEYIPLLAERKTNKETAVFWPSYVGLMEGGIPEKIRDTATFIRRRTDYRFVNENMITDGILDEVKVLIIPCDIFTRCDVLDKICDWTANGGVLLVSGEVTDLELEHYPRFDKMIGFTENTDICAGVTTYEIPEDIPFKTFAAKKKFYAEKGYNNLAPDCKIIAVSKAKKVWGSFNVTTNDVYNAFYRDEEKGRVISYFGPTVINADPQGQFAHIAFPELLDDVISAYSDNLKAQENEVVRGRIDNKIFALHPDGSIKEV